MTTTLTQEQLLAFTSRSDTREYLRTPWRKAGFIYASNGYWLVCISDDGRECIEATDKHPVAEKLIAKHLRDPSTFLPMPSLASKRECGYCHLCDGRGERRVSACDDCDGEGTFRHGHHEYECQECDSRGMVGDCSAPATPCDECGGTGEQNNHGMPVGANNFATHYLRVISTLPNVLVSATEPSDGPLVFKFDGGVGLLMPRRV